MKANKTKRGWAFQTTGEEKTSNQRVALIQLHKIQSTKQASENIILIIIK
jgi:hypothetical protein